jgi:hypothetical protein
VETDHSISPGSLALRAEKAEEYLRRQLLGWDSYHTTSSKRVWAWLHDELRSEGVLIHAPDLRSSIVTGTHTVQNGIDETANETSSHCQPEVERDCMRDCELWKMESLEGVFGFNRSPAATALQLLQHSGNTRIINP